MTKRTLSLLSSFAAVFAIVGAVGMWHVHGARASTTVNSGDLIRGTSFSAVYYMGADGFRYVFPNDKTYFTWYTNFDSVKFLSDADLAKIQMGGNVTYKTNVRMIKINSDPRVYFVGHNGDLFTVPDETTAATLFGSTWNQQIDDVPDGFFSNYTVTGDDVDASVIALTAPISEYSINTDKDLIAPEEIEITSNGYSPIDVTVRVGQTVRFTNTDSEKHTATSDDLTWGTGTMSADGTFVRRFDTAGTFTFFDSYDSGNTGAIYVE